MDYLKNRIKEPSTHAGVAAFAQGMKYFFPQYSVLFDAASMVFGFVAGVRAG